MRNTDQRSAQPACRLAGLILALAVLALLAANLVYIFQDGMGDDFWGGAQAPRLSTTSFGEEGLASFDVRAGRLSCPRFIGLSETKTARLRLHTRSTREEEAAIVAFISDPNSPTGSQMLSEELVLPARGEVYQTWELGPANLRPDATIRLRVYSGNKYQATMSDVRGCTIRFLQIGSIGGELAGYGTFILLLVLLWGSFAFLVKGNCRQNAMRRALSTRRGLAVTITLMSLINFFGGGLLARIFVLLGVLALVVFSVQPLMRND